MSIEVNGNGNRVAGLNYYENPTLALTPEQLKQLAPRKCPVCEQRLLGSDESSCNSCRSEEHARRLEELRAKRWAVRGYQFLFFLAIWGLYITHEGHRTGHAPLSTERFWELGGGAFGTYLLLAAAWLMAREWWWNRGREHLHHFGKWLRGQ